MFSQEQTEALTQSFQTSLMNGERYGNILQARKQAEIILGQRIKSGSPIAKAIDEVIESAVVRVARAKISDARTMHEAYDQLVDLLDRQPNLSVRSSTSIRDQAYSTPVAIGFLVATLAGVTPESMVYEPTAGRGALLLTATPENAIVNEINPNRAADLRAQGYRVTEADALKHPPPQSVDVVLMNPPFGTIRTNGVTEQWRVSGGAATPIYTTTQIDQAIVLKSLTAMKDDGKAAIIIAAPMSNKTGNKEESANSYNSRQNAPFWKSLYDNYNVTNHFCISGELYVRQGTTFPVDVVIIEGRSRSMRPYPAAELPTVYRSFDDLKERLPDGNLLLHSRSQSVLDSPDRGHSDATTLRGSRSESDADRSELQSLSDPALGSGRLDDSQFDRTSEFGAGLPGDSEAVERTPTVHDRDPSDRGRLDRLGGSFNNNEQQPASRADPDRTIRVPRPDAEAGIRVDSELDSNDLTQSMADSTRTNVPPSIMNDINTPKQVAYQPQSVASTGNTLVPTNLQTAMKQSLERLERRIGSIDGFVNDKVNLSTTRIQPLAEQIDSAALIIDNLERGEAFVLGDQTGIGKGLQLAEIAKAHLNGTISYHSDRAVPNLVFVTYDSKLYADFLRDLRDVGIDQINPLITNSELKLDIPGSGKLRTGDSKAQTELLRSLTRTGDLKDYNIVFTTYSQLQTVKGNETARRDFFRAIAPDSLFIFDESHNAGGTKSDTIQPGPANRADFVRQLVRDAGGVVFSSATYAKNPYTMTLYASRTGMRHAVEDRFSFDGMVQAGGVPMQQMIAAKLAESGQYIRRERSYEGVSFDVKQVVVDKPIAENLSQVMQRTMQFDAAKQAAVRELKKEAQKEAKQILGDGSTGAAGVSSTNFTSIMHNVIAQALLALKAKATVEETLQVLRNNEKPVIALYNTMGSIIERAADDQSLKPGDPIDLSVGDLLLRYLERSRDVLIKDAFGTRTTHRLTDEELGIQALSIYEDTVELIESINWSEIPISPIDHIRQQLEAEGYRTAEITGRTDRIEYQDGQQVYQTRSTKERSPAAAIKNVSDFNNGDIDVILLNRSGSTGISLHASERFADQRPRHMLIAQPDLDINQFMQTLGRVHRTGQVELPSFSLVVGDIPAEKRPAAVLLKKMASLNANTTAARESSFSLGEVVDFLNEYGDQVAVEVMANYPDLHKQLGRPIGGLTEEADLTNIDTDGAIAKITGRIPLLSLAQQERLYSLIEREYTELVERERVMGNNILEAETVDLNAKTLGRMEILPAKADIESPFADAVYLEVVEVKSPRKPYTSLEVINLVRQELELPTVETLEQHDNTEVEERGRERANRTLTELGQQVEKYRERVNTKHVRSAVDEDDPTKVTAKIEYFNRRLDAQVAQVMQKVAMFPVGQPVTIVNQKSLELYYGVVQQVESRADVGTNTGSNPAAPSMWRLRLQVADAAQQILIPFSKINADSLTALRITAEAENWSGVATIDQFDLRQTETRERRQMFTGNVIRAAEQFNGKLLNYTTEDGQIRQGMLMPRSFALDKVLDEQPVLLPSPADCQRFFAAINYQGTLKTVDQQLSVMECKDGTLKLTTDPSKQKGGKYYLDERLLAVAGSDFVQSGSMMSLSVEARDRDRVYDYIYENYGKLRTFSQQDKAREMLGLEKPSVDAIDTLLSQLPPHIEVKDPGADAIRLESLFKLEAERPEPSKAESPTPLTAESLPGEALSTELSSNLTRILPPEQQTGKAAKNIARFLDQAELAEAVLGGTDGSFHLRIEHEPYLPLVIECHGNELLYFTHYIESNGDLIHDGEMVFAINNGYLKLSSTAVQDYLRGGEHRACDHRFAAMFSENIFLQGFAEAANAAYLSKLETIQTTNEAPFEQSSTEESDQAESISTEPTIDIVSDTEETFQPEPFLDPFDVAPTGVPTVDVIANPTQVVDTPIADQPADQPTKSQQIESDSTSELEQNQVISDKIDTTGKILPEIQSNSSPVSDLQFFTIIDSLELPQENISFQVVQSEAISAERPKAQVLPADSPSIEEIPLESIGALIAAPLEWQVECEEIVEDSSHTADEVPRSSVVSDSVFTEACIEFSNSDAAIPPQATSQAPVTLEDLRDWYRQAHDIGKSETHLKRIEVIGKAFRFEQQPLNERQLEVMTEDKLLWTKQAETIADQARSILEREEGKEQLDNGVFFRGKQYTLFETKDRLYVTAPGRGVPASESDHSVLPEKALPPNYGIILKKVKGEIDLKATTVTNADAPRFEKFALRPLVITNQRSQSTSSYER